MVAIQGAVYVDFDSTPGQFGGDTPIVMAQKLLNLRQRLSSFRTPLYDAVRTVLAPAIRDSFNDAYGPDGPWEPLSKRTYELGTTAPLYRTGHLQRTVSYFNNWKLSKTEARFVIPESVEYGEFHLTGFWNVIFMSGTGVYFKNQKGGMSQDLAPTWVPARPWVYLNKEDEERVYNVFDRWVVDKVVEAM